MSKLIVALGNPGKEYESTRHNIAWTAMEHLSFSSNFNWMKKFKGYYSHSTISGTKYFFLKPQTYMNLSGESVCKLANFFKIELEDILVLHDEMDLEFGTIAFKQGGGLAGHNGLRSIADRMGGRDFKRLRLGIGRPVHGSDSNWVLSPFGPDERIHLDIYLDTIVEAIETYMKRGFSFAASNFSRKSILPEKGV
ncbi:MAG: aminoacyl-tRNA hydrolase [Bacteriovoracaceae bacterium]|nr:aminoacyl-tRNA hydrolase [Bacteriovoracaceae bacterium]